MSACERNIVNLVEKDKTKLKRRPDYQQFIQHFDLFSLVNELKIICFVLKKFTFLFSIIYAYKPIKFSSSWHQLW